MVEYYKFKVFPLLSFVDVCMEKVKIKKFNDQMCS